MSDNTKGELIKKQNSVAPKKKLVIKKIKKIIIKKKPDSTVKPYDKKQQVIKKPIGESQKKNIL